MAEIKSTIDIIMERTKNLTISEDEKQAIREREFEAKARGLLSRYRDGSIDAGFISDEIGREIDKGSHGRRIFRQALLDSLDPDADCGATLKLMKELLGVDPSKAEEVLASFPKAVSSLEAARSVKILEALRGEGISGSAVTPNCATDESWHEEMRKIKEKIKREMAAALA